MKGKLITDVTTSDNEMIVIGTEVEIVDIRYGCEVYYMCIIPSGRQIMINANDIEITDYNRCIDWEQRRYELAKSAMQGILSEETEVSYACSEADYKKGEKHTIPKSIARFAIACADALINELKGE